MLFCSIGLDIWGSLMEDKSYERDLKDVVFNYNSSQPLADDKFDMRSWIYSVYWSIYGLCIIAGPLSIIGLIGAISQKKPVLATCLVLIVIFFIMELGGSIALWSKRGSLRSLLYRFANDIYLTNSVFDISIIQNTYNCCGVQDGQWKCPNAPSCDIALFNSVDNTMMISGIILIPVLLLQIVIIGAAVLVLVFEPRNVLRKIEAQHENPAWESSE